MIKPNLEFLIQFQDPDLSSNGIFKAVISGLA